MASASLTSSESKMPGSAGVVGSGPADSAGEISVAVVEYALEVAVSRRSATLIGTRPDLDRSFNLRRADGAGDVDVAVELQIGSLVLDDLEVVRLQLDVDGADGALMDRKAPADGQRILVVVEDLELADRDLIRLQVDTRIESGVGHAEIGRGESATLDVNAAVEVRIVSGSSDLEIRLQHTGDVCDVRSKTLDHPEIDLAAGHFEVDCFARWGLAVIMAKRRRSRPEQGDRRKTLRSNP